MTTNTKRDVLVLTPSTKCALDLKVVGSLAPRAVKTLADGSLRVRVGNAWKAVSEPTSHAGVAPLRMVVRSVAAADLLPTFKPSC